MFCRKSLGLRNIPYQNLALKAFGNHLARIIGRYDLELYTETRHSGVAKLWLQYIPGLAHLITNGSSFRQTVTLFDNQHLLWLLAQRLRVHSPA